MTRDPPAGAPRSNPRTRPPAVAGSFYPRTRENLLSAIEGAFLDPRGPGSLPDRRAKRKERTLLAGVVPHAGYMYSGAIAAHFYRKVADMRPPETVLVLGVNHHGLGGLFSLSDENWETPLGVVPTDRELLKALNRPPLDVDGPAHRREHSIEVELPFLQYLWGEKLRIVALQVTFTERSLLEEVGALIRETIRGKDVLLLASSDLSHYLPPSEARHWDGIAIESLLSLAPEKLYDTVVRNDISMCGIAPVTVLLAALRGSGGHAQLLQQGTSGDVEPMDTVVGYASVGVEH